MSFIQPIGISTGEKTRVASVNFGSREKMCSVFSSEDNFTLLYVRLSEWLSVHYPGETILDRELSVEPCDDKPDQDTTIDMTE